ncbi:MAG: acetylpolyamine amidohydrolase [Chloroflexi bacterium]|nr:acetylpolyamine amidohydrolase [Chloroflexota bacterium]HCU72214.1 acetylpolyamine amidohydrolase [Chloroflexota bacterium]|tara:strand:+ start:349 stop:1440 length:1092 start_codon:yes stop_codon:yes gene_type:complete
MLSNRAMISHESLLWTLLLQIPLVCSDIHVAHAPRLQTVDGREHQHPEVPDRARVIERALVRANLATPIKPVVHADVTIDEVHDPEYRRFIKNVCQEISEGACLTPRGISLDPKALQSKDPAIRVGHYAFGQDAPLMRGTYRAAREACDIALTGLDHVRNGARHVFALCRPPGHHAEYARMGGFCYFNNAVVAAHSFSSQGRVAMLDLDYHHGNGSQNLTYERADILYVSLHADPAFAYPGFSGWQEEVGVGAGEGYNANFPLRAYLAIGEYLSSLEQACEVVVAFDPDLVIVSIGFDTHTEDPIAQLSLDSCDFGRIAACVDAMGLPTLHVLEGGYALDYLGESAMSYVQGLSPGTSSPMGH